MSLGQFFNYIFYIFVFFSIYAQVFFFVTFLENRKKIIRREGPISLKDYPAVTIAVPCWNEEKTVEKTVKSLLRLNYPKDKLHIFLVNDGSTDRTGKVIEKFKKHPNVSIFHKKNGGKFTALNLSLQKSTTEYFGCLDADSYADPEALVRLMSYFEHDPKIMAVTPSIAVHNPKNIIQMAQQAEYDMGVYLKKMLGFFNAINVTPGPMTIFKRKVFEDLGPYRHGHTTEDMEIAYRMQRHQYRIEQCNDAFVYTSTPPTLRKLYRQRTRWVYGFINNTIDYRDVLFKKKYGNFATFTLPFGILSIFTISFLFGRMAYNLFNYISSKIAIYQAVGWQPVFNLGNWLAHLDPFFINTQSFLFLVLLAYAFVIFAMIFGRRMLAGKWEISWSVFYYLSIFTIAAPFWLLKAFYSTVVNRRPAWR